MYPRPKVPALKAEVPLPLQMSGWTRDPQMLTAAHRAPDVTKTDTVTIWIGRHNPCRKKTYRQRERQKPPLAKPSIQTWTRKPGFGKCVAPSFSARSDSFCLPQLKKRFQSFNGNKSPFGELVIQEGAAGPLYPSRWQTD